MAGYQAAEKLQETSVSLHQSTSVSATSSCPANTVTTMSCNTVTVSAEDTCGNKIRAKTACSKSGIESTDRKSNPVSCTVAVTSVSNVQCSSQSMHAKPPMKSSSECQARSKLATDKTKSSQPLAPPSSSLTTDTSPQILVKMAKNKRAHKIGQPLVDTNSPQHPAGPKTNQQSVPASSSSSSSSANSASVKHRHSVGSHASTLESRSSSQLETTSKLITPLPNGLVTHRNKTCGKADNLLQTTAATQHGHSAKPLTHLPNGLKAHADKSFATKTGRASQNGANPQHGSKLETEPTNGPSTGSTEKTSEKNDTHLEQNGHVTVSKPSESCGQSSSLMDMSAYRPLVNGHSNQNAAAAAAVTKGKKARRKGRGKEALSSVGE